MFLRVDTLSQKFILRYSSVLIFSYTPHNKCPMLARILRTPSLRRLWLRNSFDGQANSCQSTRSHLLFLNILNTQNTMHHINKTALEMLSCVPFHLQQSKFATRFVLSYPEHVHCIIACLSDLK